jgi:hypothetical protein
MKSPKMYEGGIQSYSRSSKTVPADGCGVKWSRGFCFRPEGRIVIAAIFCLLSWLPRGEAAERAVSLVQSALRSEIDLDLDERHRLLEAALVLAPNLAEAHWARGEVRVNGQWRSLESIAVEASARSDLKEYESERSRSGDTIEGHARMADYCHKHRLAGQERAHWSAVLTLDPNHAAARQRLGQINLNGVWIDERELEQQRKTERATYDYCIKHSTALSRLLNGLDNKSLTSEQVVTQLARFRDPLVIPWLEFYLSSRGAAGGKCTVAALGSISAPEASVSLVRHALDFPHESVRIAATDLLKRRDEQSYIPVLLAALKSPVTRRDQFAITRGNLLIWRRSIFAESQDSKQAVTFDRKFSLDESFPNANAATADWTQRAMLDGNMELNQLNAQIKSTNHRVMELLENVTLESSSPPLPTFAERKRTPEEWWNWWNDRIESFPSGAKPVLARYEVAFVPAVVIQEASRPRSECLAPGTEICTQVGPIAVDDIQIGDMVLTQNQRTGELKFVPVLATSKRPPEPLVCLTIGSETIRATGGHPFWVSGKGWIKARSLQPGMGLHTAAGVVMLDGIEQETQRTATHNLIVDECHSYFVGQHKILSHDNTVREPVAHCVPGLSSSEVNPH